jgi:HD-like signal output (HDOD) protein
MKRWFARLFGGARSMPSAYAGAAPESGARPSGSSDPAQAAAPLPPGLDLDLAFFHWLAGPHVSGAAASDTLVLDELARLLRAPEDAAALVPRVPAVIPQLLRSLRDDASSATALARQLAQDAVLVAEVIREVNSPYYQPSSPVRSLEGALLLLGQNGLRMLLARVAFRPIISQQAGRLARLVAPQLWSQSEQCALAASLLAPRHGADPFEAYLAGLMHNIGLVVALRVIDQLLPAGALPDHDAFGTRLVRDARRLSASIAAQWELPPAIGHAIAAISYADADSHSDPGALAAVLGEADGLAKLHMLAGGGQPGFVRAVLALPPELRPVYDKLDDRSDQAQTPQDP